MKNISLLHMTMLATALLMTACIHPISKEARERTDQQIDLAMVSENPKAFIDSGLLVGGVVMSVESTEEGSVLEVMEWQLNRWGEPLYLLDAGRLFLVKTSERLDPEIYQAGTLVTLSGVVLGSEIRLSGQHEYSYPVFALTEIHLWDLPFRYGIHNTPDPAYPYYVDQSDDPHRHPYDTRYNPYPYTQFWYRNYRY